MTVSFKTTTEEYRTIDKIVARIFNKKDQEIYEGKTVASMDLMATNANGCPLDLKKLLKADDFNFLHDIAGIAKHLDRTTGKLQNLFVPRCAK